MPTAAYPSGTNLYLPRATGQAVAFFVDRENNPLVEYVQFVPEAKPTGTYWVVDPDFPVRVTGPADYYWQDGDPRPEPQEQIRFRMKSFRIERANYGFNAGDQAVETAEGMDLFAVSQAAVLSQAVTMKTLRILTEAEKDAVWGRNVADASAINGSTDDLSLATSTPGPNYQAIQKVYDGVANYLNLVTNGAVKRRHLRAVMTPEVATAMGRSDEVQAFVKNNAFGLAQVKGENFGEETGMPPKYRGVRTVVEDSAAVRGNANAADDIETDANQGRIKAHNSILFVCQPGGMKGVPGSKSFATVQCRYYKYELAVEAERDAWNKRRRGAVVDQFHEEVTAPRSGFKVRISIPDVETFTYLPS